MRRFYLGIFILIFGLQLNAQELNCRIQINSQKIKGTNRQKFTAMRTAIFEFMNENKWTSDIYSVEEKIECTMTLNLTDSAPPVIMISALPNFKLSIAEIMAFVLDAQALTTA